MKTRVPFLTFLFLLTGAISTEGASNCPSDCSELIEERAALNARINRLESIKQSNLKFIAKVGQDEISKRIKVSSNLLAIDRRLSELKPKLKEVDDGYRDKHCNQCEGK